MEVETIFIHVAAITYSNSFNTSQNPRLLQREGRELIPITDLGLANGSGRELPCCANQYWDNIGLLQLLFIQSSFLFFYQLKLMLIQQNSDCRFVFCSVPQLSFIKNFNLKLHHGKSHRAKMGNLLRAFHFKPRSGLLSAISFLFGFFSVFRVFGLMGGFFVLFCLCLFIPSNNVLKICRSSF